MRSSRWSRSGVDVRSADSVAGGVRSLAFAEEGRSDSFAFGLSERDWGLPDLAAGPFLGVPLAALGGGLSAVSSRFSCARAKPRKTMARTSPATQHRFANRPIELLCIAFIVCRLQRCGLPQMAQRDCAPCPVRLRKQSQEECPNGKRAPKRPEVEPVVGIERFVLCFPRKFSYRTV